MYIFYKWNRNGVKNAFINRKGYKAIKKNNLFDIGHYLKNNNDVRLDGMDPILHYIYYGFREGRKLNFSFDDDNYIRMSDDTKLNPLIYYSLYAINDGMKIIESQKACGIKFQIDELKEIKSEFDKLYENYKLLVDSGLFDVNWYVKQCKNVDFTEIDPILHYLEVGTNEGRDPSPHFNNEYYLKIYSDVAKAKINPLVHFIEHGAAERRNPSPIFDSLWYVEQFNPPLPREENPLFHYINVGMENGFDTSSRLKYDPDHQGINTLFFSHNLKMQGAQNSLYEMVIGLKNGGIVNPIVYSPSDGALRNAYEKNEVKVIIGDDKLQEPCSLEDFNNNLSELINELETLKIQFIHSNTLRTFYGIEIARKMCIPCSWNPRESEPSGTYFDYLPEPIKQIALNCFNYPYKVIFVSNYTKKNWEHLNNNNFTTIYNALNTERLIINSVNWTREEARVSLGIKDDEIAIIAVGTISERKGQKDIL